MMNESRKSNDQKSERISYESDSDDSVVYKFVENLLLSRANELTNLSTLKRKDENKMSNSLECASLVGGKSPVDMECTNPVELYKDNSEKIMQPKTNKRKVSNLK